MITGDPRVFAKRTYLDLRYPRPIYDMPTATHARAAFLSNASYVRLNEGFDEANAYAMGQGFLLDEELSTNVGVVAHHPLTNKTFIALRGAQMTPDNPEETLISARDRTNVARTLAGKQVHDDGVRFMLRNARAKYGTIDGLYGYSLGGQRVLDAVRSNAIDAEEVMVLQPLIGARDVRKGIPENIQIARTIEDFASGPGLALALRNNTRLYAQIDTVQGLEGGGAHDLTHFFPSEPEARGATLEESALRDPATRAQVLDTLQGEHLGFKGAGVSLASYVAADRIVEAVGGKQQPVPKEVETGLLAGGLAGAGKELIRNRTAVKAAIKSPTSVTASALRTGAKAAAFTAGAEIPGAVAGIVAGEETYKAVKESMSDKPPILQEEVADVVSGAAAGGAAALATDAVIATVGVGAALATGTEIGAVAGSLGGPLGVATGAVAGAAIGLGVWAISELFG